MPAIGGPNITEDGLVFAYDLGNVRSYKGEPTTNILNDNILGHGAGASLGEDAVGKYIQLSHYTTSYSRFQLPSIPVSSNDTYTWSFEIMCLDDVTGGMSFDTNEYSEQYPNSNDLSRLTYTHQTPSSLTAGKWEKVSLTVTMKDGLTGAYTYDFFRFFYPTFTNKRVYYRNMQFELKDHPTQYAGQGATRSNTEGLVDLTNNIPVDLSNVSFDSNAQVAFDGTDDSMSLIPFNIDVSGGLSYEVVYSSDSSHNSWGEYHYLLFFLGYGHYGLLHEGDSRGWRLDVASIDQVRIGVTTNTPATNIGDYYHIIVSYDPVTGGKGYLNGEQIGSWTGGYTPHPISGLRIGGQGTSSKLWEGQIPLVKIYNRGLTPEEVSQNYNSIKNRFNL